MQNLIPEFGLLEKLLDSIVAVCSCTVLVCDLVRIIDTLSPIMQSCGIEKAFLFDVVSKIYVCTDSSPVDMQTYELCSDMIDVVIDVSYIYGYVNNFAFPKTGNNRHVIP